MKITKFEISNFKGIEKTSIGLSDKIPGNIITLIGLNESGKTTILEALSHFITEDEATASFVGTVHQKSSPQELIPKDKKAAFTGQISVRAFIELNASDIENLRQHFLDDHSLVLDVSDADKTLTMTRTYDFEDSKSTAIRSYWSTTFPLRKKKEKNFRVYSSSEATRDTWMSGINYLRARVPGIVYFPTFLFNFPDRIYLENEVAAEADSVTEQTNSYYRQILEDVLHNRNKTLSIKKHILDRIVDLRDLYPTPATFFAHLLGLDEKSQIDAVVQQLANEMSRVIFGAWAEILGRAATDKRVHVKWFIDSEKNNAPYLEVSIVDGQSSYSLSERSLGFRWFFSFLLFTQFRKMRDVKTGTIFLFDEPAANLHSKAQIKLLDSFARIAGENTFVVYSTHSHYMVNPLWLEKAYIVENKAVDFEDKDEMNSFSVRKTDIKAIKYREFVSANPTKTTYFQPVLDALDVVVSPLEPSSKAVVLEGKFDFHPFTYFVKRMGNGLPTNVFPADGAGGLGLLINIFRGRGIDFCILLDDDKAGRTAKKIYVSEYLLAENVVPTLGDIAPDLKGKSFEGVYQQDVRDSVKAFFKTDALKKRHFSLYFQELLATNADINFPETEKMFGELGKWVASQFKT